mgnify:CR=1 FL=1
MRASVVSPDGRWIAGVRDHPTVGDLAASIRKGLRRAFGDLFWWELVVLPPDGAGERTVLSRSHATAGFEPEPGDLDWWVTVRALAPHDLTWSPDGRQFAFVSAMNWDPKGPPIKKQVELFIYDVPTGRLTQVTHDNLEQCTPVWME